MWNIPPQDMGYGAPPPMGAYGAPPPQGYGPPPGQGAYGAPPPMGAFDVPPMGGYGAPPMGGYGAPPQGGYGGPPAGQYGAPPPNGYGAPPPGQYGAPPQNYGPPAGQYGAPPPNGYGAPPPGQYGAPPPGGYGAPPPNGYGAPQSGYGAPPGGYNGDPMFAPPGTYSNGVAFGAGGMKAQYGAGQKKALLIGINYIRHQRGQLRGCINDVHTISEFLSRYGFQGANVRILTDDQQDPSKQPTKENILRDIRWLTAGAAPGDSLFFHFSGHGGQVKDLNGDEEDGMDETILPVDYDKNGQIIDDILHDMLVKTLPPGCKLTSLMDCCHSGTGLDLPHIHSLTGSSYSYSGGGSSGVTTTSKLKKKAKKKIMSTITSALIGSSGGYGGGSSGTYSTGDCFLYSGCRDDQTSADTSFNGKPQGAMTYAFTQTLTKRPNQSYGEVLKGMREILQSAKFTQVPQLSTQNPIDLNAPFTL